MLEVYPGLFKGYGEIGLYAREDGSGALPPDSKRLWVAQSNPKAKRGTVQAIKDLVKKHSVDL